MESDERKFLHDLASPAASITLILETLTDELKEKPDMPPDLIRLLGSASNSMQKIVQMLTARREVLIQRSKNDGQN